MKNVSLKLNKEYNQFEGVTRGTVVSIAEGEYSNKNGTMYTPCTVDIPGVGRKSALILTKHLDRIEVDGEYTINVRMTNDDKREVTLSVAPVDIAERATASDFDFTIDGEVEAPAEKFDKAKATTANVSSEAV